MENYFKEKGVFLSSTNLDSTLLLNCLHALLSHYPSLRFTSITTDDKLGGFRVLFSGPEVTAVLEKKQLRIDDEVVGIYPLTTVLSIFDVGAFENPLLEDDVLEAINEKYGKVFEVIKFDSEAVLDALSKKFENSFDAAKIESLEKKWRVRIDVPEFEGLEIFRSEYERFISLSKWNKNLKVAFWCRCCKMCGHFQHSCPKKLQPVVAVRSEGFLNGKSNFTDEDKRLSPTIHLQSVSSLATEVPSECSESFSSEISVSSFDTEKVQKARKSFRNSDEENQSYKKMKTNDSVSSVKSDQSKNFLNVKNIKKEIVEDDYDDDDANTPNKKGIRNMECEQSDNTDNENQSDAEADVRRFLSFEEETKLCIDTASNDASDFAGKETKSDENSNSTFADDKEKEKFNPSRAATPSGPSHPATATSSSILGAADTSILSDELQGYINHACETVGALDRQTLDAFLGYVKKKNKPTQIALKYTPNVKQLKDQLQMILTLRYHTKPTNQVKEDAVFIKWLEGLVSRFDNTKPSKRKRPGQD